MPLAVWLAIFVSLPGLGPSLSRLTGVWVLNRDRSDFGALEKPRQFLMRVELADQSLAVWEITTTEEGRTVVYRHVHLRGTGCQAEAPSSGASSVCWVEPDGGNTEENWQLSATGELVITRQSHTGLRVIPERIVLAPSKEVVE